MSRERDVVGGNRRGIHPYLLYQYTRQVGIVISRINLCGKRNRFKPVSHQSVLDLSCAHKHSGELNIGVGNFKAT
jgi:hypothetical protein